MHHLKMFTDKISSGRDKDYLKEKMDQEKVGENTYGGALHEFCHYKVQSNLFKAKYLTKVSLIDQLEIFKKLTSVIRDQIDISTSREFYLENYLKEE